MEERNVSWALVCDRRRCCLDSEASVAIERVPCYLFYIARTETILTELHLCLHDLDLRDTNTGTNELLANLSIEVYSIF